MREISEELVSRYEAMLPRTLSPSLIPRIIHLTYWTARLPPPLARNVEALRTANPGWKYRFYDDAAMNDFVRERYGDSIYREFDRIAPSYGVVRADLFRYMVIYALGGVYLDIKSGFAQPIDETLTGEEAFVTSHWDNLEGEAHEGWGLHPDLETHPRGELQQWHVIARPGHPFLRRVIASVLARASVYRPWYDSVGWLGVITLSGPITYTRAITPLLSHYPHRQLQDHRELGLVYNAIPQLDHQTLFKGHYVENHRPIVTLPYHLEPFSRLYATARKWRRRSQGRRLSER